METPTKEKAIDKLNERQKAFVRAYPKCNFIGYKAAKEAGFEGNDATLAVDASRLLKNANIKQALSEYLAELREEEKPELREQVIGEWKKGAFSEIRDSLKGKSLEWLSTYLGLSEAEKQEFNITIISAKETESW